MSSTESLIEAIDHARAGRHAAAEEILRGVLAVEPDNAHALFLLGECALVADHPAEAVGLLTRSVALRPRHRDSRLNLARALLASSHPSEALATLELLAADADLAAAQVLRGTALNALGRPAEAIAAFRNALRVLPDDPEALLNCGNAHADLDEAEEAERLLRRAIACRPEMVEAHVSLAHLLTAAGRLPEALAASAAAMALDPDHPAAHWNRGVAQQQGGDMAESWAEYEWRKRRFPESFAAPPGPQ